MYADDDEESTRLWLQFRRLAINNDYPWASPFAAVDESNAMVPVTFAHCHPAVEGPAFPVLIRIPSARFPLTPAPEDRCFDGTVSILDRTTYLVHESFEWRWNDGRPTASHYRRYDIRGLGHGTELGDRSRGMTASGVANIFGALQPWEVTTPGHRIGHAFHLVLPRKPQHPAPQLIGKRIQWPATAGDGTACRPEENNGPIPYGGCWRSHQSKKADRTWRSWG